MRYSLLSRFQGAFLGAALGEILGTSRWSQVQSKGLLSWLDVAEWGFSELKPSALTLGWGKIAIAETIRLIQRKELEQPDERITALLSAQAVSSNCSSVPAAETSFNAAGVAIAFLPMMLNFHDDLAKLQHQILKTLSIWQPTLQVNPEFVNAIFVFGDVVSLALREQLYPDSLISQLMTDLDLSNSPVLTQQLTHIQTLISGGSGLTSASATLNSTPFRSSEPGVIAGGAIAAALYSFLKTPEDFRLSLLQMARLGYQPHLTCGLVGALSGIGNGVAGLPLDWRTCLRRGELEPLSSLTLLWDVPSEEKLLQLADQLLSTWSGVYDPSQRLKHPTQPSAIAASDVIRPL